MNYRAFGFNRWKQLDIFPQTNNSSKDEGPAWNTLQIKGCSLGLSFTLVLLGK
jgi:hypothetical protein